jgi:phosphatidylserine/phosphatidylglycerophosphate/cardiolipin synthase-like enzyme
MSTRFSGRFLSSETDGGPTSALLGLRVTLIDGTILLGGGLGTSVLGSTVVDNADGLVQFVDYRRDTTEGGRRLEIVITDLSGRRVAFRTADGRMIVDDTSDPTLHVGDVVVRAADAYGLLATLGTGQTSIQSPNGFGWGFTPGNRVTTLMDEDAFRHAAKLFRDAKEAIAISQLFFPLPEGFRADATKEQTRLIFDFAGTQPDAAHLPRKAGAAAGDSRPERLLLDAANGRGVDVRLVLNDVKVPLFIRIAAGALIFPFAGTDGVYATMRFFDEHWTDTDEVNAYFTAAAAPKVRAIGFKQPVAGSAGVMHAKLVVADWSHALSIGSPFGQSYFDTHDHVIEGPIRGGSDGFPKHDAGFAISGPAVAHLQETIKLLWDTVSDDKMTSFPGPTAPIDGDGPAPRSSAVLDAAQEEDGVCDVQIVRTISAGRFKDVPGIPEDGEKGILEAYQRAIAAAEDFVYLETQYFTNDAIGDAIVGAIKARRNRPAGADGKVPPDLQVIVLCNIQPDVPFYPFKQRRLIHRIREAIGEDVQNPKWFAVFTRWSHDLPPTLPGHLQARPRMLPIYVHAKAAVVDNQWATVGSANLDGLSLDSMLLWDKLNALVGFDLFRQQRAIEVNGCFINDAQKSSPVIDRLRRKLWSEHLGFRTAQGGPDLDEPALAARPADGWLGLWQRRAKAALQSVIDTPLQSLDGHARVLPWPTRNTTYKMPRVHLDALGVKTYKVVPLRSTRKFDFDLGDYDPKSRVEMDYD